MTMGSKQNHLVIIALIMTSVSLALTPNDPCWQDLDLLGPMEKIKCLQKSLHYSPEVDITNRTFYMPVFVQTMVIVHRNVENKPRLVLNFSEIQRIFSDQAFGADLSNRLITYFNTNVQRLLWRDEEGCGASMGFTKAFNTILGRTESSYKTATADEAASVAGIMDGVLTYLPLTDPALMHHTTIVGYELPNKTVLSTNDEILHSVQSRIDETILNQTLINNTDFYRPLTLTPDPSENYYPFYAVGYIVLNTTSQYDACLQLRSIFPTIYQLIENDNIVYEEETQQLRLLTISPKKVIDLIKNNCNVNLTDGPSEIGTDEWILGLRTFDLVVIVVAIILLGLFATIMGLMVKRKVNKIRDQADGNWIVPPRSVSIGARLSLISSRLSLRTTKSGASDISLSYGTKNNKNNSDTPANNGGQDDMNMTRETNDYDQNSEDAKTKLHLQNMKSLVDQELRTLETKSGWIPEEKKDIIIYRACHDKIPSQLNKFTRRKIAQLLRTAKHENVLHMRGMLSFEPHLQSGSLKSYHVYDLPGKGSLHHLLTKSPYIFNTDIKFMLATDISRGMLYLQKQGIVHGLLDTFNCLLDNNWTVKIANWAQTIVCEFEGDKTSMVTPKINFDQMKLSLTDNQIQRLIFRHPTLIRNMGGFEGLQRKHDLYSYAMVLVAIFTRETPHSEGSAIIGWKDVLDEVVHKNKGIIFSPEIPKSVRDLITKLTKEDTVMTFEGVNMTLELNRPNAMGMVDILMGAMEQYMASLEDKVEERTSELRSITDKMSQLLESMFPKEVAIKLQNGQSVSPEFYQEATVYFSDIVSFTKLSSESTALEVVNLLNALYILFDGVIDSRDVYKVETIGDAYMCVSGVPKRNGQEHVKHICETALDIVDAMTEFQVPHRKDYKLNIRIGMNSGSVMAGVVGLKMPRYCLFGDVVNTASRMESTSLPNKIQASEYTVKVLQSNYPNMFQCQLRGETQVKV